MAQSSVESDSYSLGLYIGRAGLTVWLEAETRVSPFPADKSLVRCFCLGSTGEYQAGRDAIIG